MKSKSLDQWSNNALTIGNYSVMQNGAQGISDAVNALAEAFGTR